MILFVTQDRLTNETCKLTWNDFEFLTGSKIDLSKRIGKQISVLRSKGHLYIYDSEFIVGEKYKNEYSSIIFTCNYINDNKQALLSHEMNVITVSNPSNYRIV